MSLDSGLLNPVPGFDPYRTEDEDGESGQQETRQPARKKRVLTAARKEQNRLAQRAFRQRRRERREELKVSAGSAGDRTRKTPALRSKPLPGSLPADEDPFLDADAIDLSSMDADAIRMGAVDVDGSLDCSLTDSSGISLMSDADFTLSLSLTSPTSSGSSGNTTSPPAFRPSASDPFANTLEFKESTMLAAMLRNASALGFDLDLVGSCRYDMMSPLFRPATPASDPTALLSAFDRGGKNAALPPDLRPTLNQILIPHHVSLDLIPFPALRDRIIVLSAAMPATFNMWELKLDIYERGGLGVVKSRRGGKGSLQPWDRRSWVATPWFLKKWRVIVEDEREQLEGGGRV